VVVRTLYIGDRNCCSVVSRGVDLAEFYFGMVFVQFCKKNFKIGVFSSFLVLPN